MSLLIFIVHLSVLIFFINRISYFKNSGLSGIELNLFFLIKVMFGFILIYVYSRFYPERNLADVFKYFDDANVIYENGAANGLSLWHVFSGIGFERNSEYANLLLHNTHHFDKKGGGCLESNHLIVIRANLLLRSISGGNIFIHSLWFSFLSFIGFTGVYQFLEKWFSSKLLFLKIVLFCFPSLLFWSSGLLKEALLFLGLGLALFSFEQFYFREKKFLLFLFALASLFTWFLKPFVCIAFISALLFFVLYRFSKRAFYVSFITCFLLVLSFASKLSDELISKRSEFVQVARGNKSGSIVDSEFYADKSIGQLLAITPKSLFAVFFEPVCFRDFSLLQFPFLMESLFLIFSLILFLRYIDFRNSDKSLLIFLVFFSLLQMMIIGWSVPIVGAIVRYRVTATPFIWIFLLHLINLNKFKYEFNKLYRIIKP
jgi:hypothetical protein